MAAKHLVATMCRVDKSSGVPRGYLLVTIQKSPQLNLLL